jgi:hypothetical protein
MGEGAFPVSAVSSQNASGFVLNDCGDMESVCMLGTLSSFVAMVRCHGWYLPAHTLQVSLDLHSAVKYSSLAFYVTVIFI